MKTKLRILIAENERDMREFIREALERLGHEVVGVCVTGRDLITTAQKTTPDLILADVRMPETDGIEPARVINRERPVPVILITAYHDDETLARAGDDYVVGYLL